MTTFAQQSLKYRRCMVWEFERSLLQDRRWPLDMTMTIISNLDQRAHDMIDESATMMGAEAIAAQPEPCETCASTTMRDGELVHFDEMCFK